MATRLGRHPCNRSTSKPCSEECAIPYECMPLSGHATDQSGILTLESVVYKDFLSSDTASSLRVLFYYAHCCLTTVAH